jgi:hypothetical protein
VRETQQSDLMVAAGGRLYSQFVWPGRHVLSAHGLQIRGGHDVGPSSYEFLPSGLGTRTAMLQIAEKCLVSETFRQLLHHRAESRDVLLRDRAPARAAESRL